MTATHVLARIHAVLVWVVLLPVALYRRVLSPMKRVPTCRFVPTCSEYAIDAVRRLEDLLRERQVGQREHADDEERGNDRDQVQPLR